MRQAPNSTQSFPRVYGNALSPLMLITGNRVAAHLQRDQGGFGGVLPLHCERGRMPQRHHRCRGEGIGAGRRPTMPVRCAGGVVATRCAFGNVAAMRGVHYRKSKEDDTPAPWCAKTGCPCRMRLFRTEQSESTCGQRIKLSRVSRRTRCSCLLQNPLDRRGCATPDDASIRSQANALYHPPPKLDIRAASLQDNTPSSVVEIHGRSCDWHGRDLSSEQTPRTPSSC